MSRNLISERTHRIMIDYEDAFEAWGFKVDLHFDPDHVPRLVVTSK